MIEALGPAVVSAALGLLAGRCWRKRKRQVAKYPCPWTPCGYPLPETPLVSSPETHSKYADYGSEDCQGCGQRVQWSRYERKYMRVTK